MYNDKCFMYNCNNNRSRAARARGFVALCAVPLGYSVLGAVATIPSTPVHAQSFSGVGFLPGGGTSVALGVSADGTVVVGINSSSFAVTNQAFRWTAAGGMIGLGYLPGDSQSVSAAVNADGSVVAGYSTSGIAGRFPQAIRRTGPGGLIGLGYLSGYNGSTAAGVSADGSVVVGISYINEMCCDTQAVRWTAAGGMVGLGSVSGYYRVSFATGVNADGSVVVGFSNTGIPGPGPVQAFRWSAGGGMVGLGYLPGGNKSFANAVNADGSVVVGAANAPGGAYLHQEASRWTQASGMAGLGFLTGGNYSEARAVNADGTVVVGVSDTGPNTEAFRWTQTGSMQSVQAVLTAKGVRTTGWTLTSAQGVSADGQVIVGVGVDPNGRTQGWIARLGPPFLAFSATLNIDCGGPPPEDTFNLHSSFTLSSTASNGINPVTEPVTLQVGTFTTTIPPGSFSKHKNGSFTFAGVIGGVSLDALINHTGTLRYEFDAKGQGASLTGTTNPVTVALTIGDDRGTTSVTAHIAR
jgi:probable HAF family extracellular repeat protein